MNRGIYEGLQQLAQERDIPVEELIEDLENAMAKAYKKHVGMPESAIVTVNLDTRLGEFRVYAHKEVVGVVTSDQTQISLEEAQKLDEKYEVGDLYEVEVPTEHLDMGRIAASTAMQVLKQNIRERENKHAVDELKRREGDIVSATIQRFEGRNAIVAIGRVEGLLAYSEQVPTERYRFNERLRVYVLQVIDREKGIRAMVSRTHPRLVERLLALEVPEIEEGQIEVKAVAREPGVRAKVAVTSRNPRVDAVGSCIGHRGARVQAVTDELFGERVDVILWHSDPQLFIMEALGPARVNRAELDEANNEAMVVVPNNQLSLAIGRNGVNVRLASKLTNWKLNVRSEAQLAQERSGKSLSPEEIQHSSASPEAPETPEAPEAPGTPEAPATTEQAHAAG